MPRRLTPLISGQFYHVFNRAIDYRITFSEKREYDHAYKTIDYYRFHSLPVKYSIFRRWPLKRKEEVRKSLEREQNNGDIISYCLMPNHFHLLIKQNFDNGISKFVSNFQNSYTRYFNCKHNRIGSLFLDQFKAVRIETEEQLLHISRYIHLNPYTSYIVKSIDELIVYSWSSLKQYLGLEVGICETKDILSYFKKPDYYKKFIIDQADYQRKLDQINHLKLD